MRSIYLTVVIVALSLIASSLPLKNAQAATLGYTTIGAQTDSGDSNFISAIKFTMPNGSGTVMSMSVYIASPVSAAPNNQFQLAIYSDSAGSPGSLIASSQSGVITPNAWNTAAVVANLSANATYWLAYNTNGTASANNNFKLDGGTAGQYQWRAQAFGTWPVTFGTVAGSSPDQASIYATYNTTSPDTTPDPFSFTSQTGVAVNTVATSNTITPTGYNAAAAISVSAGGSYSINSGAFVTTAGTLSPGQTVGVSQTSSGAFSTTTTVTLTIGGVAGNFAVTTQAAPDNTPPTVLSVTPPDAAAGVATNTAVTVAFSESIDAATISTSTIQLKDSTNASVTSTVTYNATTFVATLTPVAALATSTSYTLTVSGGTNGVKDLAGNALAANFTSAFTTTAVQSDTTPPTVASVNPANSATGVPRNRRVFVTFSENMDPATISTNTVQLRNSSNTLITATVAYDSATRVATLTPSARLASSTTFTLTVRGGTTDPRVRDLAGNALAADFTSTFRTGTTSDTTAPIVSSVNPANGAAGVATNLVVTVTFNENMDPTTISTSTIQLVNTASSALIAATVTYNVTTRMATLTPSTVLASATRYTVKALGGTTGLRVKDLSGNALATTFSSTFSTAGTDSTPPTAPTGLTATVVSSSQINLSWTASTDNLGVTGYRVFRGGTQIATVAAPTTSYSNTGLSPSTSYSYTVAAYDAAGNLSDQSNMAIATTAPGGTGQIKFPNLSVIMPSGAIAVVQTPTGRQFQYTNDTFNGGPGPLVIQPVLNLASGAYEGTQLVYAQSNSGVWSLAQSIPVAGAFVFHAAHGHFHFPFLSFGLYTDANGSPGAPVAISGKIGFCINDSFMYAPTLPNAGALGNLGPCTDPTSLRGLNIGAADEYDKTDEGQSISIDNLADGTYWLRAVVDPDNYLAESDKNNNETDVKLTISGTTVQVLQTVTPVLPAPPSISVTSPSDGSTLSGTVQFTASTSMTSGVQFLLDGQPLGSVVTSGPPYSVPWNTATVPNGAHWLAAQTTDPTGRLGTSPVVKVTVSNSGTTPPVVTLTDPTAASAVSAVVTLAATVAASNTIASVSFFVDNVAVGTPLTAAPYLTPWNTETVADGQHSITVSATDILGKVGTSPEVIVAVDNSHPPKVIGKEVTVSVHGIGLITTPVFSTSTVDDLLVAFVGYDGPSGSPQTASVSGAGLAWTLAKRSNFQSGTAEIWVAKASGLLNGVDVTAHPENSSSYHGSLTVIAFTNASGVGLMGQASAPSGAPDIFLPGVLAGNWVFAAGFDWDHAIARTPVSGQVLVHQWVDTPSDVTFWVQSTTAPSTANGLVDIHDTAPTTDQWNYVAVEIVAARQ